MKVEEQGIREMKEDLLFELGVEEIPATVVLPALEQMEAAIKAGLERVRLAHGEMTVYGTPRRLAIIVREVQTRQDDANVEYKGPAVAQAFDAEGKPTKAAEGFARAKGIAVEDLEKVETEKGTFLYARVVEPGKDAVEVLPAVLEVVTTGLTFPKTMRWGDGDFRFCRPLRWIVALLGGEVVGVKVAGIEAGRVTRGHRVFGKRVIELASPAEYIEKLRENFVVADHRERKQQIIEGAKEAAAEVGGVPRLHEDLVDEVTFLAEHPTAIVGSFDARFMDLPPAVAQKVLEGHQRFFAVEDADGKLLPNFISLRDGAAEGADVVRRGNEWVVEPRLEDAEFYMHEDAKVAFAERVEMLRRVTFLAGLGTLYDKTQRLVRLVEWLGEKVGADEQTIEVAKRAAELSKCDLTTMMIGDSKLGELQGNIGAEYARRSGESEAVAQAIGEQYLPKGALSDLPKSGAGRLLAAADRLDNLVACYALGLRPTGSADPYALRRQMGGLVWLGRIGQVRFDFEGGVRVAYGLLAADADGEIDDIGQVTDGLRDLANGAIAAVANANGLPYDLARAVASGGWSDFDEAWQRIRLAERKSRHPEWEHVVLSGQRISNILRPVRDQVPAELKPEAFVEPQEVALFEAAKAADEAMKEATEKGEWERLWDEVVKLAPAIGELFDEVMVMAEDEDVRKNRLALLSYVEKVLYRLADFREVVLA